ncbi:MAG: tetratricopeptide repeat protein [Candidatus Eremiobacteraeota bacterium]|nr:tetratricopeptide repeat protein [Candidatus Eremiobacteraeota bacterium]
MATEIRWSILIAMKCFFHEEKEAVGVCKSCQRGLCKECAVEVEKGIACKNQCEDDVKDINMISEYSLRMVKAGAVAGSIGRVGLVYTLLGSIVALGGLFLIFVLSQPISGLTAFLFGILLTAFGVRSLQEAKKVKGSSEQKAPMKKSVRTLLITLALLAAFGIASVPIRTAYKWYVVLPRQQKQIMNGYRLLQQERFDEALSTFDLMLKKDPEDISAIMGKAAVYTKKKEYDKALAIYDKLLKNNPSYEFILDAKAALLQMQGKDDEALALYDKALAEHPESCNLM